MTTKALSKLGFNADVFLGLYDDNKYVYQLKQEFNQERMPALTLDGFNYLITKGTKEEITQALNGRRMSGDQRTELTKILAKNG